MPHSFLKIVCIGVKLTASEEKSLMFSAFAKAELSKSPILNTTIESFIQQLSLSWKTSENEKSQT